MLTTDQQAALDAIAAHRIHPTSVAFLLEGGAGTGKTFLLGEVLKGATERPIACCAPTHKAMRVLRRKLDAFGVEWQVSFDSYVGDTDTVITGVTAQLLGIGPVVGDNQGIELSFGKTSGGILSKVMPALIIIDEASMLAMHDFIGLCALAKKAGSKIIAVGDAGQLPPVKQSPIPFANFKNKAVLRQIVRQAEGSAITKIAWAIREGQDWRSIAGQGVVRTTGLTEDFLSAVRAPGDSPEEERTVAIAYTNDRVNYLQEHACQKLYNHGRADFAPGELVLCDTNIYRGTGRRKMLMAANQDELIVERFDEGGADPVLGVPVVLRHQGGGHHFSANYLSGEQLANKAHPYNIELVSRLSYAKALQDRYKGGEIAVNAARCQAWVRYFDWRDQTVISFRHPFALTSHKSQGSTYRQVFVDAGDIAKHSSAGLYVAVTRPSTELVI
jgi:exodeoxyribonuclease V